MVFHSGQVKISSCKKITTVFNDQVIEIQTEKYTRIDILNTKRLARIVVLQLSKKERMRIE